MPATHFLNIAIPLPDLAVLLQVKFIRLPDLARHIVTPNFAVAKFYYSQAG